MTTLFPTKITAAAVFSPCGKYRFQLTRAWESEEEGTSPWVCLIGLNPSLAGKDNNDPTITRMIGFARRWNCGGLIVVNLSPRIDPYPSGLDLPSDPVDENMEWIKNSVLGCEMTVACWGAESCAIERSKEVLAMLKKEGVGEIHCFGKTKDGHPRHPLYLPNRTELEVFA